MKDWETVRLGKTEETRLLTTVCYLDLNPETEKKYIIGKVLKYQKVCN